MAATNQFSAILNGAKNNTLTSQLFQGKTPVSPFTSTTPAPSPFTSQYSATKGPMSTQPQTTAASANVKSPQAPKPAAPAPQSFTPNPSAGANETVAAGANTPGYSYTNGILSSVGGQPTNNAPKAPEPSTAVKKTTTQNSDGSATTTEYHAPESTKTTAGTNQTPTYPGLVTSLANNSLAGSPVAASSASSLYNLGQKNPATTGPALNAYNQSVTDLENLKTGIAAQYGGIESQPIPLEFQQGREQALSRQYASQLDAGQQAVNQQQAALGYQIQGNQAQQTALNSAGVLGNAGQGLLQSGLTSAASAAAPQLGSIGQVPFSPLDQNQGQVLGSTQQGGVAAAGNLLGQLQGAQAAGAAPGQAQAANTQTAGTAGVQANQQVFQKAYGDYKTLENAVGNVDQFGNLLIQNMGGINPTDARYANRTISQIRGQLSSPQQAQFDTTLAALTSKVSGLLSVGGNEIPTDISAAANKIIDGSLPVGSLTAVLQRIQQEGNILLQNQGNLVNSSYSGLTGGSNGSTSNSNANSTPAGWL